MTADSSPDGRLGRALASLRGLAVGDALGSQFFVPANLVSQLFYFTRG